MRTLDELISDSPMFAGLEPAGEVPDLTTLRGSLAPDGAVAKITGKEGLSFSGRARVFDGEESATAAILAGRRARVPGVVSPGSSAVKRQAEQEGLDRIFREAGLEWVASGCSMCVGMNGDTVPPGERCASTTNRNFRGRQGPGSRTHLMSPAMVAAAAVAGHLIDSRLLARE